MSLAVRPLRENKNTPPREVVPFIPNSLGVHLDFAQINLLSLCQAFFMIGPWNLRRTLPQPSHFLLFQSLQNRHRESYCSLSDQAFKLYKPSFRPRV